MDSLEASVIFGKTWTVWWTGWYKDALPGTQEIQKLYKAMGQANNSSAWTRIALGWMYGHSQCRGDHELLEWCDKLGTMLLGPYFVKYRVDPILRHSITPDHPGNVGIQIWCSTIEDAAVVRLAYSEWVVNERAFGYVPLWNTLCGMVMTQGNLKDNGVLC